MIMMLDGAKFRKQNKQQQKSSSIIRENKKPVEHIRRRIRIIRGKKCSSYGIMIIIVWLHIYELPTTNHIYMNGRKKIN